MNEPLRVDDPESQRAPIGEHLLELRNRAIRAVVVVVVGFLVAWAFHEALFDWLMEPYSAAMLQLYPDLPQYIQFRGLIEPIAVYLKVSLLVAVIAAIPYVLLEAWLFMVPGLYAREKRLGVWFMIFTLLFFYGGVAFCRYIVLDPAVHVLLGFGGASTSPSIMMQEYFSFTARILVLFGALFELPVVISFLAMVGLVTHTFLIRHWRVAIVIMFLVGAMLTPPDPITQLALAVPLSLLYVLSIAVAWVFTTQRARAQALAEEADGAADADARVAGRREAP